MYRGSFLLTVKLYPTYSFVALFMLSIKIMNETYLFDHISLDAAYILMSAFLAYQTSESILSPQVDEYSRDAATISRFLFRFSGIFFPVYLARVVFFAALPFYVPDIQGDLSTKVFVVVVVLSEHFLECVLLLILVALFGLKLPAAFSGRHHKVKGKFRQKLSQSIEISIRLLVGPVLISTIGVAIYLSAYSISPSLKSLLLDGWIPNIIGISLFLFSIAMQAWAVVMAFWILSKSYIRLEYGDKGMQVVYRY